jgi:hypothetical protein
VALVLRKAEEEITVSDAELVAGGDKDTVYTLRTLTVQKNREIVAAHTTARANRRTHVMEDDIDWEAVNDAQFEFVLKDWKGVTATDNEGHKVSVPCTPDYKQLVDGGRRAAMLARGGMNDVMAAPEVRAESFPPLAAIR